MSDVTRRDAFMVMATGAAVTTGSGLATVRATSPSPAPEATQVPPILPTPSAQVLDRMQDAVRRLDAGLQRTEPNPIRSARVLLCRS